MTYKIKPWIYLARLHNLIGIWLLLIPGLWAIMLAYHTYKVPIGQLCKTIILFTLGAVIMRAAGCIWNDIIDKDIDAQVKRTKKRPIPNKDIKIKHAYNAAIILSLIGFIILIQFNMRTIIIGVAAIPMIAIYPFMKRIFKYPQLFLGLTFNWGAIIGWTAIANQIEITPVIVYIAGIFWTLAYDTIYAFQDAEDDAPLGVKSTALEFKQNGKTIITAFFTAFIITLTIAGWSAQVTFPFFIAIIAAIIHIIWQIKKLNLNNPQSCMKIFKANKNLGLIIVVGCALSSIFSLI